MRTVLKSGKGLPDVIQMEFQYIPSFTLTKSLLDMTPYVPEDFLSNYPEWIQKQINLGGKEIYGVPWDIGPARPHLSPGPGRQGRHQDADQDVGRVRPAAIKYHKANPESYLVNLPGGQTGQWLGLFWQNGARPFTSDPNNVKIDLTDPKIKQVTEYWDKLFKAGAISHDADFNDAWYQGFAKGKYAGWLSAAWGPIFLQDYTKSSKGKWRAQPLPQWQDGQNVSGNWGGSTLAVLRRARQAAATEFARWILSEKQPVEMFSFERFLFPPQNSMLNNPTVGGPEVRLLRRPAGQQGVRRDAAAVDKGWEWDPIHEYVDTTGDAIKGKSVDQGKGATAALQPWQDASSTTPSSKA